jgi:hypothetical protein
MKVKSPDRDPIQRPGQSAEKPKPRSVVIPLDAEDAMLALTRFCYSGEGERESYGPPRMTGEAERT